MDRGGWAPTERERTLMPREILLLQALADGENYKSIAAQHGMQVQSLKNWMRELFKNWVPTVALTLLPWLYVAV